MPSKSSLARKTVLTRKVSSRGQIVLPVEVRESLGLREGDRVEFRSSNVGWVITKHQSENVFQRYVGALRRRDALQGMSSDEFLNETRGRVPSQATEGK